MPTIIDTNTNDAAPAIHASQHSTGGTDALTPEAIGLTELDVLPVSLGGTGGVTPAEARHNLEITPTNIGAAAADHTHSELSEFVYFVTADERLPGGYITPVTTAVRTGASSTITFVPDDDHYLKNIIIDGVTYDAPHNSLTYTFTDISADHTVSAVFEECPLYGFDYDTSVSSPTESITYLYDAAGMTDEERKSTVYSWFTPSVVGSDAEMAYALQRDNLNLKADGSAAVLDGSDGEVCSSLKPIWWTGSKVGGVIRCKISEYPHLNWETAHTAGGVVRDYIHIGMFEAAGSAPYTCAYSTSLTPAVSKNLLTFRTEMDTHAEHLRSAYTFLTNAVFTILYVLAYGNLNSQSAVGNGITGYSWNEGVYPTVPTVSDMLTCSGEYGVVGDGTKLVMIFFVANPFGSVWKFLDACMWKDGKFAYAVDQLDTYNIESGYVGKPSTWREIDTGISITEGVSGYASGALGDSVAMFFPTAWTGGSSGTYLCDYMYANAGERCCICGGHWTYAATAGMFSLTVRSAPSHSDAIIGARVQILNAV